MKITTQMWLRCAAKLMPKERAEWLAAMQAELTQISDPADRNTFAKGCFKAAIFEGVRSRRGLNYIARIGGAVLMFLGCAAGLSAAMEFGAQPETLAVSKIITALCLVYMCGAALLVVSLRGLQIYAGIGFALAASGWIYCQTVRPSYEYLPAEFLTALNFEAAFLMSMLFAAAVYLRWLYSPEVNDA